MRKIFIATDHAGFRLKEALIPYIGTLEGGEQGRGEGEQYEVVDIGAYELYSKDDYPLLIKPCAEAVASSGSALGIIIGSSGQGEAMVANRVPHIRAAVFYGEVKAPSAIEEEGTQAEDGFDIVRLARKHNDANILSLGARFISEETAKKAVAVFLSTPFSTEERHQRRIAEF
jgi:ribose 5-phosphate isomerase B